MLYASAEAMCLHENFRMRTMFVYDVSLGLVDLYPFNSALICAIHIILVLLLLFWLFLLML